MKEIKLRVWPYKNGTLIIVVTSVKVTSLPLNTRFQAWGGSILAPNKTKAIESQLKAKEQKKKLKMKKQRVMLMMSILL